MPKKKKKKTKKANQTNPQRIPYFSKRNTQLEHHRTNFRETRCLTNVKSKKKLLVILARSENYFREKLYAMSKLRQHGCK